MLKKLLDATHPTYDAEYIRDLRALYAGGKTFRARIERFLVKRAQEPNEVYEVRKKEAHYRNYFGAIINQFSAVLFASKPIARIANTTGTGEVQKQDVPADDFYSKWREDCDGNGTDLDAFFKDRLTEAMVEKTAYFVIEHPPTTEADAGIDKAEFEKRGLDQVRLRKVDAVDVLDWERDKTGKLLWAITRSKESRREDPRLERGIITETWQIYTDKTVETFTVQYQKNQPLPETADISSDGAVAHRFGRVPLIELSLCQDLWIGNLLESPQLAHFRMANAETWGISRTCYAMPVFKLEDGDKMPRMGAGYGIVIGINESVDWAAPPATPFDATSRVTQTLKDEIYRIARQMAMGVENNAAAVGRSADSKLADADAMRVILGAFSREVKKHIEIVYDLASKQRDDKITWSIDGLDDFNAADLAGLMELMTELGTAGGIPSKTFNTELKKRVAFATLADLDQQQKDVISKEIADGVEEAEQNAMLLSASLTKSPPPNNPKKPPPNGKSAAQPNDAGQARGPA